MKRPVDDGTTLSKALHVVWDWKEANDLRYLSPRASRDLAERIERAMLGRAQRGRSVVMFRFEVKGRAMVGGLTSQRDV
jgi:hypothetical protein